jgi:tetratricopeptide (TPR) repeat protein
MTIRDRILLAIAAVCLIAPVAAAQESDELLTEAHRTAFERYEIARAIEIAERQLALRREAHGDASLEAAETLEALATYETLLPDYEAAEAHAREALSIRVGLLGEDHTDVAASRRRLALTLRDLDRLDEAEGLLRKALASYEDALGGDDPLVASVRTDLGMVLTEREQMDEAGAELERAISTQSALAERRELDEARTLRWYAQWLLMRHRLADAEATAKESLALRRRNHEGPHLDVAESLDLLAEIYHSQRFLEDAAEVTSEAMEIRKALVGDGHPLTLAGMHNLAVIEMSIGNHARAEPLLREVLAAERLRLGNEHPEVAFTISTLAINLSEQGKYDEAQPFYREAGEILRAIDPDHPDLRWLLDHWGRDADKRGDLDTAEARFLEVNEMSRRTTGFDHWLMMAYVAGLHVARGDYPGAETYLLRSIPAYEESRARFGPGLQAATPAASAYVSLVQVQLELDKTEQAWSTLQRVRGRTLTEMLAERHGMPGGGDGTEKVGRGFAYPRSRVQRALGSKTAIVGWVDHEVRKGSPVSWGYVLRHEGPVHWVRLDRMGTSTTLELSSKLSDYRIAVSEIDGSALGAGPDPAPTFDGARAIWNARFAPLEPWLEGVESLVVVPSEIMAGLPVESLLGPGNTPVGDRYVVSYAPSGTVHAWLHERAPHDPRIENALLLGDPPFRAAHLAAMNSGPDPTKLSASARVDRSVLRSALGGDRSALGSLPRLAWSRREVKAIEELLDSKTVLVGTRASEAELGSIEPERIEHYDVLHFATHAIVDGQRPNCSSLVLSQIGVPDADHDPCDTPADDGLLTGEEIAGGWTLDSELVTLSACETGRGRNVHHEGVIGFSHPFLQAGARSLLVSLWKVDDRATALLMARFYRNWLGAPGGDSAGGQSKAEALQDAKAWLREIEESDGSRPYEHPYYWSAFVLIGDPS